MQNKKLKIIFFCKDDIYSKIIFNSIKKTCNIQCVIIENNRPLIHSAISKFKNNSLISALGQLIFIIYYKILIKFSGKYLNELIIKYKFDISNIIHKNIYKLKNINSEETLNIINEHNPDLIFVNGTSIISERILNTKKNFIGLHMGITPKYRGVHGGYWAYINNDYKNCGVTIFQLNKGIDTGNIIFQDTIDVDSNDNIFSITIHQLNKAIPLIIKSLSLFNDGLINNTQKTLLVSKQWTHPTIVQYLINFLKTKKK